MIGLRTGLAISLACSALALASCGGDDGPAPTGEGVTTERSVPPQEVVAKADRNCERMLRDVVRVGREAAKADYRSAVELARKGFAEPGMELFKDLARRQQALRDAADSPAFDTYAASFDPIVVLGEQWLGAQRQLDLERAKRLQELLTNLGAEQQVLAQRAGLTECAVDFLDAMVRETAS
jgi:Protein of unknown function (DUF429)